MSYCQPYILDNGRYNTGKKSVSLGRILQYIVSFCLPSTYHLFFRITYIEPDTTTVCLLVPQRQVA